MDNSSFHYKERVPAVVNVAFLILALHIMPQLSLLTDFQFTLFDLILYGEKIAMGCGHNLDGLRLTL